MNDSTRYPEQGDGNDLIPAAEVMPVFEELFRLMGGKLKTAKALHVNKGFFTKPKGRVRRKTVEDARALLRSLEGQEPPPMSPNQGEAEVVCAEPLGAVLREWIVEHLRERPLMGTGGTDELFIGPIQWLAQETDLNERRISGISNGEFKHVPLSQADKLLSAIGKPYLLGKEISVIPNPNWSTERWAEYMASRGCV